MKRKGVCRMHGGKTPIKHGLYSKYVVATLDKRIEEIELDPTLTDLRYQVAVLTALQTKTLAAIGDLDPIPIGGLEIARKITDSVVRAIERYEKTQSEPDNVIPLEVLGEIIDLFSGAINRHVADPAARRAILDALQAALRRPVDVH